MMREEFEKEYKKHLEGTNLPDVLKNRVEFISCLKERQKTCTLLVRDKRDCKKYILKIAEGDRGNAMERGSRILQELQDEGIHEFPRPEMLLKEGSTTYYMREYVEGEMLLSVVKKYGCMPERVLIGTAISLCSLLEILHNQNPPVIHRDIKPENIICTKEHDFTLIDFETARKYSPYKDHDTVMLGSWPTAAPEQFGFLQTDSRTDIYGLGMTLLYLACGSYQKENIRYSEISSGLRKIIMKAVAFEPKRRYQSAAQLRRALLRYSMHMKRENK